MVDGYLVLFIVDDVCNIVLELMFLAQGQHTFEYASVNAVATLFEKLDNLRPSFVVGDIVCDDIKMFASSVAIILHHLAR